MGSGKKVTMPEMIRQRKAQPQLEVVDLTDVTISTPLSVVAAYLQKRLTQRLTAYIIGIADGRDIGRYSRNQTKPHEKQRKKLFSLYELLETTLKDENDSMIQLWLQGRNSELSGDAPARVLRNAFFENFDSVKLAAEKMSEVGR